MTSKEIRQSFLDYFKDKQHRIVPSAPVIPHGDPTLLFINAGMNQFKDVFLGSGKRDYTRAADTQKCIRVSGKHNDLEEVGVDTYHHTFFEMLGNWSFGDYYKAEAIAWAWQLLTEVWSLDKNRLFATVYRTDDESYDLWKNYLPEDRIQRHGEKDNFWEMGETGPCGPCSEIHYDRTPDNSGASLVNADSPDVIEIWNLVFIQYNRKPDGSLEDLAAKHVDTGMGFERICAVIQGKNSNYDTDVFMPVIDKIVELSGKKYSGDLNDPDGIAMRVIADHVRTLAFAIADGAVPGNEGRGYVLRRILRRGSRFARNLGFNEPVIYKLLPVLLDIMGDVFPELIKQKATIERVVKGEEESFLKTLGRGIEKFEALAESIESNSNIKSNTKDNEQLIIPGADAFLLYDTFGFPLDLTGLLAREKGFAVDTAGFEERMNKQKERSRKARKVTSQEAETIDFGGSSEFTCYDNFTEEAEVLFVKDNLMVPDKTPFYAESGGQASDTGILTLAGETYIITDVKKSGDAIIHVCDRSVEPLVGSAALLKVDIKRRRAIMRSHSATHLFHEALRQVLGGHIQQAGSYVGPDYLRFDFNHFEALSPQQIESIEAMVNEKIFEAVEVVTTILSLEDARKNDNIRMFFGDKYGDTVRAVAMDDSFSIELCGGTHVANTSRIGLFKITGESSIAAGVRRIEAVTGEGIEKYIYGLQAAINKQNNESNDLNEKIRKLEKELASYKVEEAASSLTKILSHAKIIDKAPVDKTGFDSITIATGQVEAEDADTLRSIAENLRNKLKSQGIGLLAAVNGEKVQLVCVVTDDLKNKLPAGKLVGSAARILGGGGGGKPHMATAGARDISALGDLLKYKFESIVREMLD